jgi:hypothetical protein
MLEDDSKLTLRDAETDFRRRLAEKLLQRGYSGDQLALKIEELLRRGVNLRLDVAAIMRDED